MHFRDDAQKIAALRALLRFVGLDKLIADDGPTPEATCYGAAHERCGRCPPERSMEALVFVRTALDLWNGTGNTNLAIALGLTDVERGVVFNLLAAAADDEREIDRWIESAEVLALWCERQRRRDALPETTGADVAPPRRRLARRG